MIILLVMMMMMQLVMASSVVEEMHPLNQPGHCCEYQQNFTTKILFPNVSHFKSTLYQNISNVLKVHEKI